MSMDGLTIIDNKDNDTITIISEKMGLNVIIPLIDFATISINHLETGKKMSELIKEYILTSKEGTKEE